MHWSENEYQDYLRRQGDAGTGAHASSSRAALSEEALLQQVRALAQQQGWLCYHTRDARRSDAGFPDLVLCKSGRLVFVELKSATGKPTVEQMRWLSLLGHSVPGVEVKLWRPQDWDEIVRILT